MSQITLAIQTREMAEKLQRFLAEAQIDSSLHEVSENLGFGIGVRVRIDEKDLTRALAVVNNFMIDKEFQSSEQLVDEILVPVDFSDYSLKACVLAFDMAKEMGSRVLLMHSYFVPSYNNMSFFEHRVIQKNEAETIKRIVSRAKADMLNLKNLIDRKMREGKFPNVVYNTILCEGVAEDEIVKLCEKRNPRIVVMGTRGKDRKEQDLIGSVTAEILDRARIPVVAIPEDAQLNSLTEVKNVLFMTNFGERDLFAFKKIMEMIGTQKIKVYLLHYERKQTDWNEVKLSGISAYFEKNYPSIKTECLLLKDKDFLTALDSVIEEKQIDLIAINSYKRNLLMRLFNPSIARKMIFHSHTSMLIFNS
jgi:nucleotide-binding universal stress UspA family protein